MRTPWVLIAGIAQVLACTNVPEGVLFECEPDGRCPAGLGCKAIGNARYCVAEDGGSSAGGRAAGGFASGGSAAGGSAAGGSAAGGSAAGGSAAGGSAAGGSAAGGSTAGGSAAGGSAAGGSTAGGSAAGGSAAGGSAAGGSTAGGSAAGGSAAGGSAAGGSAAGGSAAGGSAAGGSAAGGSAAGGSAGGGSAGGGSAGGVSGGGSGGGSSGGGTSGANACPGGLVSFGGLSRIAAGSFGGLGRDQLAFADGDGGLGILNSVCAGASFTSTTTVLPVIRLLPLRHDVGQPVNLVVLFGDQTSNVIQYRGAATADGGFAFQRLNPSGVVARPVAGLVVDYRGSGVEDLVVSSDSPAYSVVSYQEGSPVVQGLQPDTTAPLAFAPTSLAALRGSTWSWVWVGGPTLMGLSVAAYPRVPGGGVRTQYTGPTTTESLSHLASVQAWSTVLGVTYAGGALLSFSMSLNDVDGGSAVAAARQVPSPSGAVFFGASRAMVVGNFKYRPSDPVPSLVTAGFSGTVTIAPLTYDGGVSAAFLVSPPSLPAAANDVALGDLDGDGAIDLAIALAGPPGLYVVWGRP